MGRRAFAALIDFAIIAATAIGSILTFGKRVNANDSAAEVRNTLNFVRDDTGNLLLKNGRPQLEGFTRVLDLGDLTIVFQGLMSVLAVWLIPILAIFTIGGLMQGRSGVTPGKAICRLQAIDELGRLPGVGNSLLRTVAWLVDGFPYLIPLVGPILAFSSPGHQRLGDRIGRTFVVDRAFAGELPEIPGLSAVDEPGGPSRQVVFNRATRRSSAVGGVTALAGSRRLSIEDPADLTEAPVENEELVEAGAAVEATADADGATIAAPDARNARDEVTPIRAKANEGKAVDDSVEEESIEQELVEEELVEEDLVEEDLVEEELVEEEYLTDGEDDFDDEEFGDTSIDRDAVAAQLAGLDLAGINKGDGLRRRRQPSEASTGGAVDIDTTAEGEEAATVNLSAALRRRRARRARTDDDNR